MRPVRRIGVNEPDNVKCCEYFEEIAGQNDDNIYEMMIGDLAFDQEMKDRLAHILTYREEKYGRQDGPALKVMAGLGRNLVVLKQFFPQVEMLE